MRARGAFAFAAALAAVFCLGIWFGGHPGRLPGWLRSPFVAESVALNAEATEAIEDNYFRAVDGAELGNASLQGMVRELRRRHRDRFSEYFSPEALRHFNEALSGTFTGIGVSAATVPRGLRVVRVFPGSPAARAGIVAGETIVAVDGQPIAGEDSAEATGRIKGPEGGEVTLRVRSPSGAARRLRLRRAQVAVPVVSRRLIEVGGETLGYVRLLAFSRGAGARLRQAVKALQEEGATGIVLDLRGNGGGFLEEAVQAASAFLPAGSVVVKTNSRSQGRTVHRAVGGNLPRLPTVVLIDRNTASAAEILAAALEDDGGATVVGQRSYGKGVFQQEVGLANGGALKLTVGEYFTPAGLNLARSHGIHPDVRVRDDPGTPPDEARERALGVLAGKVDG